MDTGTWMVCVGITPPHRQSNVIATSESQKEFHRDFIIADFKIVATAPVFSKKKKKKKIGSTSS